MDRFGGLQQLSSVVWSGWIAEKIMSRYWADHEHYSGSLERLSQNLLVCIRGATLGAGSVQWWSGYRGLLLI